MGRSKNSNDTYAFELAVLNRVKYFIKILINKIIYFKLVDTKDAENSETLLHGLIFLMHKKFGGKYTNFANEDFHHVTKASKIDANELEKTKNSLKNSIRKVTNYQKLK